MTVQATAQVPRLTHALRRHHRTRAEVFRRMVADPTATWTCGSLAEAMPDHSVEGIRVTVYQLMVCKALELVPRQRSLVVRLTPGAADVLSQQLRSWIIDSGVREEVQAIQAVNASTHWATFNTGLYERIMPVLREL